MSLSEYRIRAEHEAALWYCLMIKRKQQYSECESHSHAIDGDLYYRFIMSHPKFTAYVKLLALIGAFLSVYLVWQVSPLVSIWILALIVFAGLLSFWGFQRKSGISLLFICSLAYLVSAHLPDPNALIPGDGPIPPNPCANYLSPNDQLVILGRQAIATGNTGPQNILKEDDHVLLKIDTTSDYLFLSADLYDPQGLVVRIDRNRVKTSPTTFPPDRPDRHTLRAYDHWGNTILSVRFINKRTIKTAGRFWLPGHELFVFPELPSETEPQQVTGPICYKIKKGSHVGSVILF